MITQIIFVVNKGQVTLFQQTLQKGTSDPSASKILIACLSKFSFVILTKPKAQPSASLKVLTKLQLLRLDQNQPQNFRSNFSLKSQTSNLDQTASILWPNIAQTYTSNSRPNCRQPSSASTSATLTTSSKARITSVKSTKQQSVGQSVTDKSRQRSDLGPRKINISKHEAVMVSTTCWDWKSDHYWDFHLCLSTATWFFFQVMYSELNNCAGNIATLISILENYQNACEKFSTAGALWISSVPQVTWQILPSWVKSLSCNLIPPDTLSRLFADRPPP